MKFRIPNFSTAKVLVVDGLMLDDRDRYGGTSRFSHEVPVLDVQVNDTKERVGGAGNAARLINDEGKRVRTLLVL